MARAGKSAPAISTSVSRRAMLSLGLLACSVVMVAVLIERGLAFRRNGRLDVRALRADILTLLSKDRPDEALTLCASTPGPVSAVLLAIEMVADKATIREGCNLCGACREACTFEAISIEVGAEPAPAANSSGVWVLAEQRDGCVL